MENIVAVVIPYQVRRTYDGAGGIYLGIPHEHSLNTNFIATLNEKASLSKTLKYIKLMPLEVPEVLKTGFNGITTWLHISLRHNKDKGREKRYAWADLEKVKELAQEAKEKLEFYAQSTAFLEQHGWKSYSEHEPPEDTVVEVGFFNESRQFKQGFYKYVEFDADENGDGDLYIVWYKAVFPTTFIETDDFTLPNGKYREDLYWKPVKEKFDFSVTNNVFVVEGEDWLL